MTMFIITDDVSLYHAIFPRKVKRAPTYEEFYRKTGYIHFMSI